MTLVILVVAACEGADSETTSDEPRLLLEETLPPPTITPLRLPSLTPSPTLGESPTLTPRETRSAFLLRTATPPDSPTPTVTDTATRAPIATATRTLLPTRTFTPSPTATGMPLLTRSPVVSPSPVGCSLTWFFTPPPTNCPLTEPVQTVAAFQPMEGGYMIWVQSGLTIFALFDDGSPAWVALQDTYLEGENVTTNENPPSGLYALQRGFGKLWMVDPILRDRLGWGTESEIGYTALIQADSVTGIRYISGPNNEVFALGQTEWQRYR